MLSADHQGTSAGGMGAVGRGTKACCCPRAIAETAMTIAKAATIPRMPKPFFQCGVCTMEGCSTPLVLAGDRLTSDVTNSEDSGGYARSRPTACTSYRNVGWRNLPTRLRREFRSCSNCQKALIKHAPRQAIRMQKINVCSGAVSSVMSTAIRMGRSKRGCANGVC
jgi:hypothetical protein